MDKVSTGNLHEWTEYEELTEKLAIDCGKCSGLCCTALCFSKLDGFPEDNRTFSG